MADINIIKQSVQNGSVANKISRLYGKSNLEAQQKRYLKALDAFCDNFGEHGDIRIVSTPGRSEIGGNHTDHNAGRVLAAAVNLDVIGFVRKNENNLIEIVSEGFGKEIVDITNIEKDEAEKYTSRALIKGVLYRMNQLGYQIGGFCAYFTSVVLKGSGLSSSAAYEANLVTVLNALYNDGKIDAIENAKISQYAENEFFSKPCGLMDQTACAVGSFVYIDFEDFEAPIVKKVDFDFEKSGYALCVVDTGGNHADLNEDYAAIEDEMKSVARVFEKDVLARIDKSTVLSNIKMLREKVNDRAILRAVHFFDDDMRVEKLVSAIDKNDFSQFNRLIIESGYSSFMYCQNVFSISAYKEQPLAIGLLMCENILTGRGSYRVHGGGFAGTIQAFVPNDMLDEFKKQMTAVFGEKSFYQLMIRPEGSVEIKVD